MPTNTRWRVVLSLMNVTVAGVDALHFVILATVVTTQASTSQTTQHQIGLVVLGLSLLLSLSCSLGIWLIQKRNVGCSMVVNALIFLSRALAELDHNDALDISYEQLKMDQVAAGY